MNFAQTLTELGADRHQLTTEQLAQVRREGYLIIPSVFTREECAGFDAAAKALIKSLDLGINEADGGYRIHDLIGRAEFERAWTHPQLIAVARDWIGEEFKPMSVNYRDPLPGAKCQALHSDNTATAYCQAIVPLVDLTADNGPPRVVPRSHQLKHFPQQEMADDTAAHPREIPLIAPAGSAIFFDGNLWHSGTANRASAERPVLHVGYMCRYSDSVEMERQRGVISAAIYRRMSKAVRNFLAFPVYDPDYKFGAGTGKAPLVLT